ncbi:hypothetical protein AAC387_Pa07g3879 [Persea americana]
MDDMNMSPPSSNTNMTMMQMTFFWGKDVDILFSGWPGHRLGMYLMALFFVFALSVTVEWLATFRFTKLGANRVWARLGQTGVHVLRVGLAYMVMLAVMSFNAGVLIVAVVGHAVGFLLFATSLLKQPNSDEPDLK